jgi:hypothetical protein
MDIDHDPSQLGVTGKRFFELERGALRLVS